MHHKDNLEVKLNAHGEPDIDFYVNEAHRLRAEVLHGMAADTGAWLRRQFRHLIHALHLDGRHASLHH